MTDHHDPEDRRRQVGEALLQTVAEHGMDRTTIRRVADTAGVSVGLVQRYFQTKDDLLRFGIEYVYRRTRERFHGVALKPPVRGVVTAMAEALLPLDDERERESRVWLAFVQASLNHAAQRKTHLRATGELLDGLREALEGAQRSGELDASLDPRQEALALAAFIDGLTVNGVATKPPFDRAAIHATLHAYLARLFRGGAS